jgi:predicted dehydrogenase
MNATKIGVVGAGWPAVQHINGFRKLREIELVLCDADAKRLEHAAKEHHIEKTFVSYAEMLEQARLDAVCIATPNFLHAQMTEAALARGLHVLCEKPMAMNALEAQRMAAAAERAKKVLMIAYKMRFERENQYLKQLIVDGELGNIYFARAAWVRRRGIPGMGGWFTDKTKSGGGSLIDIGVHVMDLALWFMGYPEMQSVSSSYGSMFGIHGRGGWGGGVAQGVHFDVDDYAVAHVRFGKGSSMIAQSSWAAHIERDRVEFELWGDKGGAKLNPLAVFSERGGTPVTLTPQLDTGYPFDAQSRAFIDCIRDARENPCPPEQGVAVMKIIDAIYAGDEAAREAR